MASEGKSRPSTEHLSQGLDRATYKTYHNPHRHLVAPLQPADPDERTSIGSPSLEDIKLGNDKSVFSQVFKKLSEVVKAKADENSSVSTTVPLLAQSPPKDVENDRLFRSAPEQKGPKFKEVVKNPVSTVQSALHGASGAKFAETIVSQVIAHGAENAKSEEAKIEAANNLEQLKKARQDSFVIWALDRHVLMVRRVPPHTTSWPKLGDFGTTTQDVRKRMQWAGHGHHVGYHVDILPRHIPYSCLRWGKRSTLEDPKAKYWKASSLSPGALREVKRPEDVEMTALNITQLIEEHGSHGWTDALRLDLGPRLLLQLEDLANVLEIWGK
ncbi:MAG: hypothetical protein Q9178_006864 [Gyalolechia marmorata]